MDKEKLIKESKKAREKAYVPYSKFPVGAALLVKTEQSIMAVILKTPPIV